MKWNDYKKQIKSLSKEEVKEIETLAEKASNTKSEKHWFDIQGSIEIDVEEEEFTTEFYLWLESKGWAFFGITKPSAEEEDE